MDDETFVFGSFRLVPAQRMLLDDGKPLRVGSRALDILITLVEHAGEMISKEQLIACTWPDTVVDDGALRVHVAALRNALWGWPSGQTLCRQQPRPRLRLCRTGDAPASAFGNRPAKQRSGE